MNVVAALPADGGLIGAACGPGFIVKKLKFPVGLEESRR
jgi:hypothetical protein